MTRRGYPYTGDTGLHPADTILQFLTPNGDGTGTNQATGDYTVATGTPTRFYIEVPAGQSYDLHVLYVSISDDNGMLASEYGNLNTVLANGITLDVRDENDTVILDMMAGHPVTTNGEWGDHTGNTELQDWGSGNDYVFSRWNFLITGGSLFLPEGWNLGISFTDNFTGMVEHTFKLAGHKILR
jgi:hypothetical protein